MQTYYSLPGTLRAKTSFLNMTDTGTAEGDAVKELN